MSADAKLQKAAHHLKNQEFKQARRILEPLSLTNDRALQLLDELEDLETEFQDQSKGVRWRLWGLILGIIVLMTLPFVYLGVVSQDISDQQEQALIANEGRGSEDNPIASNGRVVFDDYEITISRYRFPGTQLVAAMNEENDAPADGAEYLLIYGSMLCNRPEDQSCRGSEISFRVFDTDDEEWTQNIELDLEPNFYADAAQGGDIVEGWIAFEFPENRGATLFKVTNLSPLANLFILPPTGN